MKFNKHLLKEKWFAYTFAACSAVILYLALTHLGVLGRFLKSVWKTGAPVFIAFVIAYVIDPLVQVYYNNVLYKISRDRLRHTLAVILSYLTVVLFFVVLMVALIPQVIDSVVMFAKNLNSYVYSFQRLMLQLSSFAARYDIDLSKFISSSDELLQSITRILPENVNKIVNVSYGLGAKVFDWVIAFILAIYLTLDNQHLKAGFVRLLRALLPDQVFNGTASFWSRCNNILIQYIAYDILDGLIIGVLNWIFMLIMHMNYVAIISVIVGVTNLAPTFGPMIGAVLGAFILVLVNPWHALWFLLFTVVLQTFDGYILKPRLFGESLGVSAVWILISIVIGGRFLGVIGILLAIPFAAIVDFIYHDYIIMRLEKRNPNDSHLAEDVMDAAADTIEEIMEEAFVKSEKESDIIKEYVVEYDDLTGEAGKTGERPASAGHAGHTGKADAAAEPAGQAEKEGKRSDSAGQSGKADAAAEPAGHAEKEGKRSEPAGQAEKSDAAAEPADSKKKAAEKVPADDKKKATEKVPADDKKKATEKVPADDKKKATEKVPADDKKKAAEDIPADEKNAAKDIPADKNNAAKEIPADGRDGAKDIPADPRPERPIKTRRPVTAIASNDHVDKA